MNIVVRTNLCAERLVQKRAATGRRRVAGALVIVVLIAFLAWQYSRAQVTELRRQHAASKSAEAVLDRDLAAAHARAAERMAQAARREPVLELAKKRWIWAPVLERVFAAMPENSEISLLQIRAADADDYIVQVTGRSAGEQPRLECDKCRLLLADALVEAGYSVTAHFARLEDSVATIRFEETDYPAAEFVIELRFKNAAG
jgi:hypothetical protein